MSYEQIDRLTNDVWFQARVRACCVEQSDTYRSDERAPIVALAEEVVRSGGGEPVLCFTRILGASPGFADKATVSGNGAAPDLLKGPIDQSRIPDGDILAAVQAHWPDVAGLYYPEI